MKKNLRLVSLFVFAFLNAGIGNATASRLVVKPVATQSSIPLVTDHYTTQILIDANDAQVVTIASRLLAQDIYAVTGQKPTVYFHPEEITAKAPIIAGTIGQSTLIDQLIKQGKVDVSPLKGKWEASLITVITHPTPTISKAILVIGSDRRGTAYGLMDISRAIGVSPWVWWADVQPAQQPSLHLEANYSLEPGPTVKYRGIFINDEDWSLIPWVKNTFDPELGNIGPKTYAKVFELMLRLKANYLWPAMHHCSDPFNKYPENARLADEYGIISGSSHCEPMLRNNVREWYPWKNPGDDKKGEWNFFNNAEQVCQYWEERVVTNKQYENIYTVGMRGIHDGDMPGGKNNIDRARKLEEVFDAQRLMLENNTSLPIEEIPQIFCPYKEVLHVYDAGLKVPDDVTICWAEDNQGYVRRLPNAEERKRSGGHGLYYHLSYWSDYLWLSSISPQLISYEFSKAAAYDVDKLWIINVGDIKICEKEIDFFMDMAWELEAWQPSAAHSWAAQWAAETFGKAYADEIGEVLNEYYRLAYAGKPEHIGHIAYTNDEMSQRLQSYEAIAQRCEALKEALPKRLRDAFIHLVYYPVVVTKCHNEKILYGRMSLMKQVDSMDVALALSSKSLQAWENVKSLTQEYNATASGKWQHMMSWHPRNRKVYDRPPLAQKDTFISSDKWQMEAIASPWRIVTLDDISDRNDGIRKLNIVDGLSADGKAVYLTPHLNSSVAPDSVLNAPYVEFKLELPDSVSRLRVVCLPTHPVNTGGGLRYAMSFNQNAPEIIDVKHKETFHQLWSCQKTMTILDEPSLRGYLYGEHEVAVSSPGEQVIRIYLLDPALVFYRLELYD